MLSLLSQMLLSGLMAWKGGSGWRAAVDHIAGADGGDLYRHEPVLALVLAVELVRQLAEQRRHLRRGGNGQGVRFRPSADGLGVESGVASQAAGRGDQEDEPKDQ